MTLTPELAAQIRADLLNPNLHLVSGVGDAGTPGEGECCTIAEIMLRLTGHLGDGPHPCVSEVIRKWVMSVQDAMPDSVRNSVEWRSAAGGIAGSATTPEAERIRCDMIMEWMWGRLADEAVLSAVPAVARPAWEQMLTERTSKSACTAEEAIKAVTGDAFSPVGYAATHASIAIAHAAIAPVVWDAANAAGTAAEAIIGARTEAAFWARADSAGLLIALIEAN
jgi:hypothetical protein